MRLGDFSVLTFDCYGTLIDWESGITAALAPWLASRGVAAAADAILAAFAAAEADAQQATPDAHYPVILERVHHAIAARFGLAPDAAAARAFGASVPDWPAFPDSAAALADLHRHYQLVILSNVDRASFQASNAKLGVTFDAVYTAEDIGSYKPDARNFAYLLEHLADRGIAREAILHTAESLFHDHVPAKRAGLATCWIHRRSGKEGFGATRAPDGAPGYDFRFASMAELAAARRAEG